MKKLLLLLTLLATQGLSAHTWKIYNETFLPIIWKLSHHLAADTEVAVNGLETKTLNIFSGTYRVMVAVDTGQKEWNTIKIDRPGGTEPAWPNHELTFTIVPKTINGKTEFVPTVYFGAPGLGDYIPENVYKRLVDIHFNKIPTLEKYLQK